MTDNNVIALGDTAHFATGGIVQFADPLDQLARYTAVLGDAVNFAQVVCRTPLVGPTFYGKPEAGAVAILYGAGLGLDPLQALQQVFVVHGQPAIYARTMRALLLGKGFRFRTVETSDESVTVEGTAPNGDVETVTWDIARARKAGYTSNKKYETDPQGMLFAKASAEVCRKLAPDVLLGISRTVEEAELDPAPMRVESERVSAAEVLGTDQQEQPADKLEDETESVPMSTRPQQNTLAKLLEADREGEPMDRAQKLAYLSEQFGRPITASNQVTFAEAEALIAYLMKPPADENSTNETAGGGE